MFARIVQMKLKASNAEFTRLIENDVIPLLRRQPGFRDEIVFVAPNGKEAVAISLWEQKEHAESYSRNAYPDVLRALEKVVSGSPKVETYEVSNSTIHNIAARAAA